MKTSHSIEIIDDLLILMDDEGNGCDSHELRNLHAADGQLRRWYKEHKFNFAAAHQAVLEFFRDLPADHADETIERIAKNVLNIPTLASRGSDRLDFHDVGVEQIKLVLRAAYEAGRQSMK